jgi:hypothetical protein
MADDTGTTSNVEILLLYHGPEPDLFLFLHPELAALTVLSALLDEGLTVVSDSDTGRR